jgi:hypothetical protein
VKTKCTCQPALETTAWQECPELLQLPAAHRGHVLCTGKYKYGAQGHMCSTLHWAVMPAQKPRSEEHGEPCPVAVYDNLRTSYRYALSFVSVSPVSTMSSTRIT